MSQNGEVDFGQVEGRLQRLCRGHENLLHSIEWNFHTLQGTLETWTPEAPPPVQVKQALALLRKATGRTMELFRSLDPISLEHLEQQTAGNRGSGLESWQPALDELHRASTLAIRKIEAYPSKPPADVQVCSTIAGWMAEDGLEPSLPGPGATTPYVEICAVVLGAFGVATDLARHASEKGLELFRESL